MLAHTDSQGPIPQPFHSSSCPLTTFMQRLWFAAPFPPAVFGPQDAGFEGDTVTVTRLYGKGYTTRISTAL